MNDWRNILFFILLLTASLGCKEFYDEEFLEDGNTVIITQDMNFVATLESTDSSLAEMNGEAQVNVQGGTATVAVNLSGIPQNIIQVHYGYSNLSCSSLSNFIPAELGTTRNYNINETLTQAGLTFDIRNSGIGENELEGKSFVIRAFNNLSDAGTGGGAIFTLACGELRAGSIEPVTN